jgi:histidinol dehydrogenase
VENHRKREQGVLVYPVYSRRSGGLSVGINLFPDQKICSFDCPYCEVFPFNTGQEFSLSGMDIDLKAALAEAKEQGITIRDICFSGNGEPTQSPFFPPALGKAFAIRDMDAPETDMVLITNGCGLLDESCFEMLRAAACADFTVWKDRGLKIWLKLDAGSPGWYKSMNRSSVPFELLKEKIRAFAKCAPVTLQTMICAIDGKAPPPEEERAWEEFVLEIAVAAAALHAVQLSVNARRAPEDPLSSALDAAFLEARVASLKRRLASSGLDVPVLVYP